jgi:hypothetical protein
MRKVRDYDAELNALRDKAKAIKARKVEQLGALVVATGADALDLEVIAGMLRHGVMEAQVDSVKESWRADGATFLGRRHLIELGGLVQKSGLVELASDDRATLYGAMLDLAGRAGGDDSEDALALWKRRGKRAFDAEAETAAKED